MKKFFVEKVIVLQYVEEFPAFCGIVNFIAVFTGVCHRQDKSSNNTQLRPIVLLCVFTLACPSIQNTVQKEFFIPLMRAT
jgi:hypothetical protein